MLFWPWIVRAHFCGHNVDQREKRTQRGLVGKFLQASSGEVTAICCENPDREGCSHRHRIRVHRIHEKRRERPAWVKAICKQHSIASYQSWITSSREERNSESDRRDKKLSNRRVVVLIAYLESTDFRIIRICFRQKKTNKFLGCGGEEEGSGSALKKTRTISF